MQHLATKSMPVLLPMHLSTSQARGFRGTSSHYCRVSVAQWNFISLAPPLQLYQFVLYSIDCVLCRSLLNLALTCLQPHYNSHILSECW